MPIKNVFDLKPEVVEMDGARDVGMRLMLSEADGAPNFNLRVFDVQPGGNTPKHSHPYEHEIFILEGKGEMLLEGEMRKIAGYDTILIPASTEHTIVNNSDSLLRLICLIPQDLNPVATKDNEKGLCGG